MSLTLFIAGCMIVSRDYDCDYDCDCDCDCDYDCDCDCDCACSRISTLTATHAFTAASYGSYRMSTHLLVVKLEQLGLTEAHMQ